MTFLLDAFVVAVLCVRVCVCYRESVVSGMHFSSSISSCHLPVASRSLQINQSVIPSVRQSVCLSFSLTIGDTRYSHCLMTRLPLGSLQATDPDVVFPVVERQLYGPAIGFLIGEYMARKSRLNLPHQLILAITFIDLF